MTPEERAAVKRRAIMALKVMRQFGFDLATTKDTLKNLLKMLDYNWEAIEANNYSLLVDSLLASTPHTNNSAGEVDFELAEPVPSTLCDGIAPVEKRQATVLAGEASSPKRTAATVDNLGDKLTNDNASSLEGAEDTDRALIPVYVHEDQMHPARKASQDNTATETSTATNKDGNFPQQRESACLQNNINKLDCSVSPDLVRNGDNLNVVEKDFESNHEEPVAEPDIIGIKCKDSDNRKKDHHVFSVTTVEIASSSNGKVKMCLSVDNESPNFRMPDMDPILKIAEGRCLEKYKMQQLEFSIMDLMKEVCEGIVKLERGDI